MSIIVENLKTFFYFEPSFFLFIGKVGSFKFKSTNGLFYEITSGFVNISQSIIIRIYMRIICIAANIAPVVLLQDTFSLYSARLLFSIKQGVSLINNLFSKSLLSTSTGWSTKLRFVGIGYKMYFFQNLLVLKLGYSHYVIYLLPYELSIMFIGRKKRSFMLSCVNQRILSLVTRHIACLRIPNVYTGKGIRLRGIVFSRKEGKRSQF